MENVRYMISDAANLVKVESHVLRYWEDELDLNIPRNELGHRYYTEENIKEFFQIKEWKEQGYQLKAIRMLVQEERMKKMAANKNTGTTQPAAGSKNTVVTQLAPQEPVHNEEMKKYSAQNTVKLEQFQNIMTNIVRNALEENNQALGREVGYQVEEKVIKEMNYLMRVLDEAEEERFRKLDAAIRTYRKGKRVKEEKPEKAGRFSRKEKKLNPNLSI